MFPFLATLLIAAPLQASSVASQPATAEPAIEVSLNNDGNFGPGNPVTVRVRTNDDGYLVVFRVDGDGHIRVLFPLDPQDDAFVRGGKEYELKGRDEGQSFFADDQPGNGMIYGAISTQPYTFRDFAANGHWDYNALRLPDSSSDAETDVTDIVARMTNRARFEYDAVAYNVQEIGTVTALGGGGGYYPGFYDPYYNPRWRCLGCGWGYPGADLGFGLDFGYSPYDDPFLFSPWGYGYDYYGYGAPGYWFPGTYPIFVSRPNHPLPAGSRPRPRPFVPSRSNAIGGRLYAPPRPSSVGTRARPRPSNLMVEGQRRGPSEGYGRPALRQARGAGTPSVGSRGEGAPGHPVYREPARPAYREPPRAEPSQRSAPPPRSAAPRAEPRGGGGGGHRR